MSIKRKKNPAPKKIKRDILKDFKKTKNSRSYSKKWIDCEVLKNESINSGIGITSTNIG